jgi:hypothetical protein
MGAITRAAANNITTGGVILPAGINDASVASVTGLAQVSAGDGITLISSQTASASASLSFTTGIDSTYRTYMFKFINGNDNDQSGSGEMYLFQPSSNTFVKHFIATGQLSLCQVFITNQLVLMLLVTEILRQQLTLLDFKRVQAT